jgi:hypothetical protein
MTITTQARLTSLLGAAAVALGAMLATATAANAEPISEGTIKSECKAAGGTYTMKKGAGRWSQCKYKDANGDTYTDDFIAGTYMGTHPA